MADMDPVRGHEQAGTRPVVIVSADLLNRGRSRLVVVVPVTRRERGIPFHLELLPPEGGLQWRSFIKCEDIRSIAQERLIRRMGHVSEETLQGVEERLCLLLDLPWRASADRDD
jgi:mRNA interferase MazF